MTNTFKAALGAFALFAAPAMADTSTVTLSTPDKSIEVTGELVGFTGTEYVVLSAVGIVSLSASAVLCEGDACAADQLGKFSVASLTPSAAATLLSQD